MNDMAPILVAAVPFGASILSLAVVGGLNSKLQAAPRGEDLDTPGMGKTMNDLSDVIQEGAM